MHSIVLAFSGLVVPLVRFLNEMLVLMGVTKTDMSMTKLGHNLMMIESKLSNLDGSG